MPNEKKPKYFQKRMKKKKQERKRKTMAKKKWGKKTDKKELFVFLGPAFSFFFFSSS